MYIVIETDRGNDCNVGAFVDAIGPYPTIEAAHQRAAELNAREHWATRYTPLCISQWHWSDLGKQDD